MNWPASATRNVDAMTAAMTAKLPRLAIIEDEPLLANMLQDSLERTGAFTVTGWYRDGATAIERILQDPPDSIIADVMLEDEMTGLEVGMALRSKLPNLGIVILSGNLDIALVGSLDPGSRYGWSFLDKKAVRDIDSIACAINAVMAGNIAIDKSILPDIAPTTRTVSPDGEEPVYNAMLTGRQQDIISLVAQGYTNAAIADKLFISERTVEHHLSTIYACLGVYPTDSTKHPRVTAVMNWLSGGSTVDNPPSAYEHDANSDNKEDN
jgi:DNA-binding NarL/FixJ family response regulator